MRTEAMGPNLPIFPDIKPSDNVSERRTKVLNQFALKIGEKTPYDSSEFERVSSIGEDARIALINGMVSLPNTEGLELFRTSEDLKYISDYEATHRALDRMYVGPVSNDDKEGLLWSRLFMESTHNSMAVRNRLRIVKEEFVKHIENAFSRQKGPFQVLSVAAGSSRAIMESLKYLNGTVRDRIVLQMVDNSSDALTDGKKLVEELGIKEAVRFTESNILRTTRYMDPNYHPEFVEAVGLFDYLPDNLIIFLLKKLKSQMSVGGVVIFSNIAPNDEQEFTHKVVGWRQMEYRNSGDLARLATDAGFGLSNVRILREPLGVYNLAMATKEIV